MSGRRGGSSQDTVPPDGATGRHSNTSLDPVWQRVWLRSQSRSWSSLAVIGTSRKTMSGPLQVVQGLAKVAWALGQDLVVIDARGVDLVRLAQVQAQIRSLSARGTRSLVALSVPAENPVTVPIAQFTEAAILCVTLGESRMVLAEQTIEQIGRDRFIGTVLLRPTSE